jgi:hypothetical protein
MTQQQPLAQPSSPLQAMYCESLKRVIPLLPCIYCQQTRSAVMAERNLIDIRFPQFGNSEAICCNPDSESRCPFCNSTSLEFMEYDFGTSRETGYSDSGEHAHCLNCGKTCEAEDTAPPVRPWKELEAVAMQDDEERVRRGYEPRIPVLKPIAIQVVRFSPAVEDEMERVRRYGKGDYTEVA